MKRSAARQLSFTLLPQGLFTYLYTVFDKLLVIKYQVLFQSRIGHAATRCGLAHGDVAVCTQKLYGPGIPDLAPRTCSARQTVSQAQALSCPFAKIQHIGVVRAQLTAKVRAAQTELARYLRHVVRDVLHAVTRRNGLLVLGMCIRTLSAPLGQTDVTGILLTAFHTIALQHQMTVVSTDNTPCTASEVQ